MQKVLSHIYNKGENRVTDHSILNIMANLTWYRLHQYTPHILCERVRMRVSQVTYLSI